MRRRPPLSAPRIFEVPESVRRADRHERRRRGVVTYEEPFELASLLRAYGVRVLSSLGPRAEQALRELADHRDPRVRQAVVEELVRHRDVEALVTIAHLAVYDEEPTVRHVAQEALSTLRREAERLASQATAPAPLLETGEVYQEPQGSTPESREPSASS